MPEPSSVLVVGATGYLGGKILAALRSQRGGTAGLRAMARNPGSDAAKALGVDVVRGDLLDRASLDAALSGVDVVVSSAAGYTRGDSRTDTEGYANLVDASAAAGVRRFVLLSILKCDLATDVPHFFNKKKIEDRLREKGVPFASVRPGAFLDQGGGWDLWAGANEGRVKSMLDPDRVWSYIHTDDVAGAVAKATDVPGIEGQIVEIGMDAPGHSFRQLAQALAKVLGKEITVVARPEWPLRAAIRIASVFSERAADMRSMLRFFESGRYVHTNPELQKKFIGDPPTAEASMRRIAVSRGWVK